MLFALRLLLTGAKMCFSINANKSFPPPPLVLFTKTELRKLAMLIICRQVDGEAENKSCYLTIYK